MAVVQAHQAAAAAQQHHFGGHFQAPQHPQQQQQPQQPEVRPHPTEMVKPVDKPSEDENKKPPGFNATPEPVETKDITTNNTNDQMPTIDDWSEDVAKEENNEMNRDNFRGRGRGYRNNSNFRGRGGKNKKKSSFLASYFAFLKTRNSNQLTPKSKTLFSKPGSPYPGLMPNSNNDYRFSVGKLPVWAKKQLCESSSPGPGPSADPDLPKGRWAAKKRDHVSVKTHFVSNSIITRPVPGIHLKVYKNPKIMK